MKSARPTTGSESLSWFKSSYSGSEGGDCVEIAHGGHHVFVRDSKNLEGPILALPAGSWVAFAQGVASGS
ncbi:DUF397 domain-containing protein [Streptomyces sp. JJ66]|uniref:DUF397 domain-containing protein n=1 Tax=Streptomyces sp. JJ66 TaxID=2803843 RepID=UPI001C564AFB|nr:DUF397 domain-containing protein [Streptomyces sp. JJ66]MBW1603228.1 DUF397 domain-containing protein [Streptomyces sp. JJ66]